MNAGSNIVECVFILCIYGPNLLFPKVLIQQSTLRIPYVCGDVSLSGSYCYIIRILSDVYSCILDSSPTSIFLIFPISHPLSAPTDMKLRSPHSRPQRINGRMMDSSCRMTGCVTPMGRQARQEHSLIHKPNTLPVRFWKVTWWGGGGGGREWSVE